MKIVDRFSLGDIRVKRNKKEIERSRGEDREECAPKKKKKNKKTKTHKNSYIGKIINATPLLSIVHKDRIGREEERAKGGNTTQGI